MLFFVILFRFLYLQQITTFSSWRAVSYLSFSQYFNKLLDDYKHTEKYPNFRQYRGGNTGDSAVSRLNLLTYTPGLEVIKLFYVQLMKI